MSRGEKKVWHTFWAAQGPLDANLVVPPKDLGINVNDPRMLVKLQDGLVSLAHRYPSTW